MNLNRTKRSNLLIVGTDQEMTDNLISLYMINVVRIAAQNRIRRTKVYLFDGLVILGEGQSEIVSKVTTHYTNQIKVAMDNYEVVKLVDNVYSEYLVRKERRSSFEVNAQSIISVVINHMEWIESIGLMLANKSINEFVNNSIDKNQDKPSNDVTSILARMDNFILDLQETKKRDTSNISHGKKLLELIENGYACGINFVMSVPDYISIKEHMYGPIQKFTNRIIYSMSNDDASRLINDAKTEQLKNNIVIYYDGINPSYQIKPYSGIMEYINHI